MSTVPKKFGFLRTTLALWGASLFAGRAGVVTDSTPGPVERWGWWDGSAWKFSARSGANESFGSLTLEGTLALNGATLQAWSTSYKPTAMGGVSTFAVFTAGGTQSLICNNLYFDASGNAVAVESSSSTRYPCYFALTAAGGISLVTSQTLPTAGGVVSDLASRWTVNRFGGCGFYGVAAPTVRPTVNAAATDLATVIALTNQLRTHLIACGLVQ